MLSIYPSNTVNTNAGGDVSGATVRSRFVGLWTLLVRRPCLALAQVLTQRFREPFAAVLPRGLLAGLLFIAIHRVWVLLRDGPHAKPDDCVCFETLASVKRLWQKGAASWRHRSYRFRGFSFHRCWPVVFPCVGRTVQRSEQALAKPTIWSVVTLSNAAVAQG